jgi:hypothetical protein
VLPLKAEVIFSPLLVACLLVDGLLLAPAAFSGDAFSNPSKATSVFDASLVYVSDYVSFVGRDEHGAVAFALDNNRGRDGENWQAEHFVVLHDQRRGWIPMEGNGSYDNSTKGLSGIPASPTFHFLGSPEHGLTISSSPNALELRIQPIPIRLERTHEGAEYWLGSAAATLQWDHREISGRVIYEFLVMPDFNRLSRTYWGLWNGFQGLYLNVENLGDLYVHQQESERLTPLLGALDGFLAVQEHTHRFQLLQVTPLQHRHGWGWYQWPMEWSVRWMDEEGAGTARLEVTHLQTVSNWILGGFAMGIVQGTVTYQGVSYPVYGLAELIM